MFNENLNIESDVLEHENSFSSIPIFTTNEKMTVYDWFNVEDCPIQRNTSMHAEFALRHHLQNASPTHMRVSAAILPDGKKYKLDGHTRSYLWEKGLLPYSDSLVYVDWYHVNTIEDVYDLYKQFDNQDAAENSLDRLHGAYRLYNFHPKNNLIKKGSITTAIKLSKNIMSYKFNIYKEIEILIPTLKLIDEENFSTAKFSRGILAALIVSVYADGVRYIDFWRRYNKDDGVRIGKNRDAVQALLEVVMVNKSKPSNQKLDHYTLAGKSMGTYLAYKSNKEYKGNVVAINFKEFVRNLVYEK